MAMEHMIGDLPDCKREIPDHELAETIRDMRDESLEIPGYVRNRRGLWCLPYYLTLTTDILPEIANGVGASRGLSRLAPDTIWLLNVRESADIHDVSYYCGGDAQDKYWADIAFYHNLRHQIYAGCRLLRWVRMIRARSYFWAVRTCGDRYFAWRGNDPRVQNRGDKKS